MIRGHIEQVTAEIASGWLYSEAAPLRDRLVLALLDGECVGAGRIEHFRQDLADAGLGDGVLGFHFPIAPLAPQDLRRVAIRLDGSDAVMLQAGAPVGRGGRADLRFAPRPESSLRWMRARGWLSDLECDFLRLIDRLGVFGHDLRAAGGGAAPEEAAAALFSAYALDAVGVERREVASPEALAALCAAPPPPEDDRTLPVLAIRCGAPGHLGVAEASHREAPPPPSQGVAEIYVDYGFGPDRLLFLHRACRIQPRGGDAVGRLEVLTAAVAESAPRRGRAVADFGG